MTNRYEAAAKELDARIEVLEKRIENWTARGFRLESIPAFEAEIAELRAKAKKWRATGKWAQELWD